MDSISLHRVTSIKGYSLLDHHIGGKQTQSISLEIEQADGRSFCVHLFSEAESLPEIDLSIMQTEPPYRQSIEKTRHVGAITLTA